GSPIIIDDEQVGVYSIYRDITEHKQAEDKIKASLKERDVMLKEIHHRVKNNMQIISSLLRLQSRSIKDHEMLEIFKECQNRIRSIALIHETLYQSKDLARINFSDYINRLTTHLFAIYRERASGINFNLNVGEVHIDINRAIPCGLVISELVSNSLKHAFPGARKGQIIVKMNMNKKGRYTLIVSDTGVGLPECLDFRQPETLGLQLVNDLVNQIGGTIELDREGGTIFTIIF
ncbi:MAG: histidine kinase dimerization/phosphoacceptor domain -containing protein, partial [Acidobacteriota bacterium]|nr:histidine kinase dimerization/phosphoacceptor domain -containing protein [Acidobacteriota bacterium]